jgi:hypothetical protein
MCNPGRLRLSPLSISGAHTVPIPVSTVRGFNSFGIEVHIPSRDADDLLEIWISRPIGEHRTNILILNGFGEAADHSVDD